MDISIVIPTLGRESVLVQSIKSILPQLQSNDELIVIDQTQLHEDETIRILQSWHDVGMIRWERVSIPSITKAMNLGGTVAKNDVILFLDDDIAADKSLIATHKSHHIDTEFELIAGRVIQPWHRNHDSKKSSEHIDVEFNSIHSREVNDFMAGNFSVKKSMLQRIGGFDENFKYAAYQFEKDFSNRFRQAGGKILYCADAIIDHYQAAEGGVRTYGSHLTTAKPGHSLGAYYYILRYEKRRWFSIGKRIFKSVRTKFHLSHPWYIPITFIAEINGLISAFKLFLKGPKLVNFRDQP